MSPASAPAALPNEGLSTEAPATQHRAHNRESKPVAGQHLLFSLNNQTDDALLSCTLLMYIAAAELAPSAAWSCSQPPTTAPVTLPSSASRREAWHVSKTRRVLMLRATEHLAEPRCCTGCLEVWRERCIAQDVAGCMLYRDVWRKCVLREFCAELW